VQGMRLKNELIHLDRSKGAPTVRRLKRFIRVRSLFHLYLYTSYIFPASLKALTSLRGVVRTVCGRQWTINSPRTS